MGISRRSKVVSVEDARKKRHQKLTEIRRRRLRGLARLFVVAGLLLTSGYLAYNAGFWDVRAVKVKGNSFVSREELVEEMGFEEGTNLLRAPVNLFRRRLERNPWIERAEVSRRLPSTLWIRLDERTPFLFISSGDGGYLLDDRGLVLTGSASATSHPVPVASGLEPVAEPEPGARLKGPLIEGVLQALGRVNDGLIGQIDSVSVLSDGKLMLYTGSGVEVVFGSPKEAAKKSFVVLKILERAEKRVVHIDVSDPDSPVVRLLSSDI